MHRMCQCMCGYSVWGLRLRTDVDHLLPDFMTFPTVSCLLNFEKKGTKKTPKTQLLALSHKKIKAQ